MGKGKLGLVLSVALVFVLTFGLVGQVTEASGPKVKFLIGFTEQPGPEHEKIVLYAVAILTAEGSHYHRLDGTADERVLFSGEVYEKYESVCRDLDKSARSARWCREYINDLDMLGLITISLSGKGVRGNTTLIRLAFPAEKVKEVIKKKFES